MQLSHDLRQELLHYHSIAEAESEEEGGAETEWMRTRVGYDSILRGLPLPGVCVDVMRDELLHNEDKFEDVGLKYEYQTLLAALGFRKRRPAKPRGYELVRDLDNPEYTIPFGKNRYCGPAALAYLLRTDPDAAAALLRQVSGAKSIKGTYSKFMFAALERYGLKGVPRHHFRSHIKRSKFRTFMGWLEEETRSADAEYLVIAGHHYVVVHGDRWFDSWCHLGKPVSNCPHLRKRVTSAWLIKSSREAPRLPG